MIWFEITSIVGVSRAKILLNIDVRSIYRILNKNQNDSESLDGFRDSDLTKNIEGKKIFRVEKI